MPPTRYRIEHHQPRQTRLIATIETDKPHGRTLDPFLSQLLLKGKQGWLRMVDETSGHVVAKRRIKAPARMLSRS